jgi:hypothetical protein
MIVTLAEAIEASESNDVLGITNRTEILRYIRRALELASYKANWNPWMGTLDVCSDCDGYVTLPYFVDVVVAANIGGCPAQFRNSWYEYHINGVGSNLCGASCGLFWDDKLWSPTFQNLQNWSLVAAICEDALDGDGTKELIVQGETIDGQYNTKEALTIPVTGPSSPGVRVKLLTGVAAIDPAVTYFKKITQVTKPVTRGYVKLIGFQPTQMSNAVTLGYYAPNETNPTYKRMRVSCKCEWVRVKFRRKNLALVNDYDIVPIASLQAMVLLLKSLRLSDTNNPDTADKYLASAVQLLTDVQTIEDGAGFGPIQVENSFGVGTLDWR